MDNIPWTIDLHTVKRGGEMKGIEVVRSKNLDLNEEKERKQIWIIRWQSGRIRSEYGTYEEAKQVAEEIGGEYIIV